MQMIAVNVSAVVNYDGMIILPDSIACMQSVHVAV